MVGKSSGVVPQLGEAVGKHAPPRKASSRGALKFVGFFGCEILNLKGPVEIKVKTVLDDKDDVDFVHDLLRMMTLLVKQRYNGFLVRYQNHEASRIKNNQQYLRLAQFAPTKYNNQIQPKHPFIIFIQILISPTQKNPR